MTPAQAMARAKAMRESQAQRVKVAQDNKRSFGDRYMATIQAEEFEEAARGFDRIVDRLTSGKASQ